MSQWRLIIVSGSDAQLSSLQLDTALGVQYGGTGQSSLSSGQVLLGNGTSGVLSVARGNITGTAQIGITGGSSAILGSGVSLKLQGDVASGSRLNDISGITPADSSFLVGNGSTWVAESGGTVRTSIGLGTGDSPVFAGATFNGNTTTNGTASADYFVGDGSGLTGLPSAAINVYNTPGDNRIITSVDSSTVQGESNLTFNGTVLGVTGRVNVTTSVTASAIQLGGVAAGVDNTVLILDTQGNVKTDEIDARVWGTTLVDGSGAATRVSYWSDTNTLTSNANFTFDGSVLTVGQSSFGTNAYVAGNLIVAGTASFQNASSLLVADKFVVFNSGSSVGDGGFIVQSETNGTGMALFYDDSATRFAVQMESGLNPSLPTGTPDAYLAAVVDVDGGSGNKSSAVHQKVGNIMISGSEAWLYF